jgi:hypothetical protein
MFIVMWISNVYVVKEVAEKPFSYLAALFGMELGGPEIILVKGRRVRQDIVGLGNGIGTEWYIIAMHEIDIVACTDTLEER